MNFKLTDMEKKILLETARESIISHLEKRNAVYTEPKGILTELCGAFVTLHKNGSLRGCIGHMTGTAPLFSTIIDMACSSAFQDPRFSPVTIKEFQEIDIEISVLSPLKRTGNISDIEVGKHGIYMKSGYNSGVLLPQVALEQKWDRDTFLTQTCYKSGLHGKAWKDTGIEIYIFSAEIFGEKTEK